MNIFLKKRNGRRLALLDMKSQYKIKIVNIYVLMKTMDIEGHSMINIELKMTSQLIWEDGLFNE